MNMKSKRIIFTVMQRGRNKMFVSHVYFCVYVWGRGAKVCVWNDTIYLI